MSATVAPEPGIVELFASEIFRSALSKPHLEATRMLLGRTVADHRRRDAQPTDGRRDLLLRRDHEIQLIDDVQLADLPPAQFQIANRLVVGSAELFYAETSKGKTTLAAARACCQATGRSWLGAEVLQPGPVVYLALEGIDAYRKRILAWKAKHGYDVREPIGVHTIQDHINLMLPSDVERLVRVLEPIKPCWVYVDTQARATVGGDENSTRDMGLLVDHIDWIRGRTGAGLTLIHHTGKDKTRGARGANNIEAAFDTVIVLDAIHGGRHVLKCSKMRGGAPYDPILLQIVPTGETVLFEEAGGEAVGFPGGSNTDTELRRNIVDELLKRTDPQPTSEIVRHVKRRKENVLDALDGLLAAGRVTCTSRGNSKLWSCAVPQETGT